MLKEVARVANLVLRNSSSRHFGTSTKTSFFMSHAVKSDKIWHAIRGKDATKLRRVLEEIFYTDETKLDALLKEKRSGETPLTADRSFLFKPSLNKTDNVFL